MNSESEELNALRKRAENGEVEAEFELGQILYFGRYVFRVHVPQDKKKGHELICRAAKKKYEPARELLAEIGPRVRAGRRAELSKNIFELIESTFGILLMGAIFLGFCGLILFGLKFLFT